LFPQFFIIFAPNPLNKYYMKKTLPIISLAFAAMLSSCGGAAKQNADGASNNTPEATSELSSKTSKAQDEIIEFSKLDINSLRKSFVIRNNDECVDTLEIAYYLPEGKVIAYGCLTSEYDCESKFDFFQFTLKNGEVFKALCYHNYYESPLIRKSGNEFLFEGDEIAGAKVDNLTQARAFAELHTDYSRTFFLDYDLEKDWKDRKNDDKGRLTEGTYRFTYEYDPNSYKDYSISIKYEDTPKAEIANAQLKVIHHFNENDFAEEECAPNYVTNEWTHSLKYITEK